MKLIKNTHNFKARELSVIESILYRSLSARVFLTEICNGEIKDKSLIDLAPIFAFPDCPLFYSSVILKECFPIGEPAILKMWNSNPYLRKFPNRRPILNELRKIL